MRNITCDICGEDIFSEERMSTNLKDLSIERSFSIRLDEVCDDCVADIASLIVKYVASKIEEKNKNCGKNNE